MTTETQLEFDFVKDDQLHFDWAYNTSLYINSGLDKILTIAPRNVITFHMHQEEVGRLDWEDGTMKFIGNADESAQMFFDGIIKRYVQGNLFKP